MSNVYIDGERRCFKFFVYGTLLRGFGNHGQISWANPEVIPARIKGRLFWAGGKGSFPCFFNVQKDAYEVQGQIMVVHPYDFKGVASALDMLEGYRGRFSDQNHYDRVVKVAVDLNGKSHRVYTYSYPDRRLETHVNRGLEISTGDWAGAWVDYRDEIYRRRFDGQEVHTPHHA